MQIADAARLEGLRHRLEQEERNQCRIEATIRAAERNDAKVVGGIYRPKPVDKAAAMLLAKAQWIDKPGAVTPKHMEAMGMKKESLEVLKKELPVLTGVLDKMNGGTTEDAVAVLGEATNHFNDACKELGKASFAFREELDRLNAASAEALGSIRSNRFAMIAETAKALDALREVRKFFIGVDYELERKRLADFVDLCERLKALKDSGFLDAVGDTMIGLAVAQKRGRGEA